MWSILECGVPREGALEALQPTALPRAFSSADFHLAVYLFPSSDSLLIDQ